MSGRNIVPTVYYTLQGTAISGGVNSNSAQVTTTISHHKTICHYKELRQSVDISYVNRRETRTETSCAVNYSHEECMYSSAPNGLCPRHEARMLTTAKSEQQSPPRSRPYAMSGLRPLSACYYTIVLRATQRGKNPKQMIGEKHKIDSQRHCKNLARGVKKA